VESIIIGLTSVEEAHRASASAQQHSAGRGGASMRPTKALLISREPAWNHCSTENESSTVGGVAVDRQLNRTAERKNPHIPNEKRRSLGRLVCAVGSPKLRVALDSTSTCAALIEHSRSPVPDRPPYNRTQVALRASTSVAAYSVAPAPGRRIQFHWVG
jgi:hypothetical protein